MQTSLTCNAASQHQENDGRSGAAVHKGRLCKLSLVTMLVAANLGNGLGGRLRWKAWMGSTTCAKGVDEIRFRYS